MIEDWACKGHLRNYPAGLGEQQVFFNTVLVEPLSRVGRDEKMTAICLELLPS